MLQKLLSRLSWLMGLKSFRWPHSASNEASLSDALDAYFSEIDAAPEIERRARFILELWAQEFGGPLNDLSYDALINGDDIEFEGGDQVVDGGYPFSPTGSTSAHRPRSPRFNTARTDRSYLPTLATWRLRGLWSPFPLVS